MLPPALLGGTGVGSEEVKEDQITEEKDGNCTGNDFAEEKDRVAVKEN